jgi:ABC-type (unclassified) transport system, ATPase component
MQYTQKGDQVVFSGAVHVIRQEIELWSDTLTVLLEKKEGAKNATQSAVDTQGSIKTIIAQGNVRIKADNGRSGNCGKATYNAAQELLTMEDKPCSWKARTRSRARSSSSTSRKTAAKSSAEKDGLKPFSTPRATCRTEAVTTLTGQNLAKRYGDRDVVRDINLDVRQGEVVGVLGPTGRARRPHSTCWRESWCPHRGQVLLDSVEITRWPLHKRARLGMSYLPQESSIFRKLTVRQNLQLILEYSGFLPGTSRSARRTGSWTNWASPARGPTGRLSVRRRAAQA